MSFYLKQVEVGLMQNFNYLIGDPQTKECAYIDPAWEVDRMLRIAEEDGYRVTQIWLTHKHFDHTEGVREAVEKPELPYSFIRWTRMKWIFLD